MLVYAYDLAEPHKRARATAVIADGGWVISTQVMQEFFVTVTRRIKNPLTPGDALEALATLALAPVVSIDAQLVRLAAESAIRHQLSLWDALIVEAAARAGCTQVTTEDLNAGQDFGGVLIVNPFS